MTVSGNRYPFTQENVDRSPTEKSVCTLYYSYITIYIGKGEGVNGIRERLQSHKRGTEGICTKKATVYQYEVCISPKVRELELLLEYKSIYDKLPSCNDVMP